MYMIQKHFLINFKQNEQIILTIALIFVQNIINLKLRGWVHYVLPKELIAWMLSKNQNLMRPNNSYLIYITVLDRKAVSNKIKSR